MKDKNSRSILNWYYIAVSTAVITIISLVILYIPGIREFDSGILQITREFLSPFFPPIIPVILNEMGNYNHAWLLITSCGILVSHKYYLKAFLLIFFTQAAYVLTDFLKGVICRQRPCGNTYPGYSFPSGHSLVGMCFWGILIYLVIRHVSGFWKYFLLTLFGAIIVLVALSRLYLGVHFPLDVISGLLIGFVMVNLYIILDKAFSR